MLKKLLWATATAHVKAQPTVHLIHQEVSVTKLRQPHVGSYAWPVFLPSLEMSDTGEQLATGQSGRWTLANLSGQKNLPMKLTGKLLPASSNFQWYLSIQTLESSLDGGSNDHNSPSHEKRCGYSNTTGVTRQWWTDHETSGSDATVRKVTKS